MTTARRPGGVGGLQRGPGSGAGPPGGRSPRAPGAWPRRANTIARERGPIEGAVRRRHRGPEVPDDGVVGRLSRRRHGPRDVVRVDHRRAALGQPAGDLRLAAADRPGDPDAHGAAAVRRDAAVSGGLGHRRTPRRSRRLLLELEPRVLGLGERPLDVGELAGDPAHLDEVRRDRRRPDRQLQLAAPEAEARQLAVEGLAPAPVGLLRQLLARPVGRGAAAGDGAPLPTALRPVSQRLRSPRRRAPRPAPCRGWRVAPPRPRPSSPPRPPPATRGSRRRTAPRARRRPPTAARRSSPAAAGRATRRRSSPAPRRGTPRSPRGRRCRGGWSARRAAAGWTAGCPAARARGATARRPTAGGPP